MDLRFFFFLNSTSVISGQWEFDNERLCAMEPHSRLKGFLTTAGLESGTAISVDQHLTY